LAASGISLWHAIARPFGQSLGREVSWRPLAIASTISGASNATRIHRRTSPRRLDQSMIFVIQITKLTGMFRGYVHRT
jgi:hypothetical protein